MHQSAFGCRALTRPDGGAYSTPPDPLAELRGRGVERGREGNRRGEEGKGGPPSV